MEKNDLALIDASELSLVDNSSLNEKQLAVLLRKTPPQFIKKRPAKGGGQWDYVTGGYMKKILNLAFGWDWSFEIIDEKILHGEVVVKGKLTCRSNGKEIIKMQFGNKDIIFLTETRVDEKGNTILDNYGKPKKFKTENPLSIGNDLKAAATDCLKKCAAEIGFAADIYNKEDFKEVRVDTKVIELSDISELFELKKENLTEDEIIYCERIMANKEKTSYKKLFKLLQSK